MIQRIVSFPRPLVLTGNPREKKQSFFLIFAFALHVFLFLGLYQLGFTKAEQTEIDASLKDQSLESYQHSFDFIVGKYGYFGLVRFFFNHHEEARLYYRYARLALYGDAEYWKTQKNLKIDAARPWPYRDVVIEYQPGALLLFIPPALISNNYDEFRFWLGAWFCAMYMFNLFLGIRLLLRDPPTLTQINRMLLWSLGFLICFGVIVVSRFDHAVVTFILISTWVFKLAMEKEGARRLLWLALFGLVASLGVLTKIVPGLVVPAGLLYLLILDRESPNPKGVLAVVFGLTIGLAGLNIGFYLWFGEGYLKSYTYHMDRGIQIETLYSGILLLAHWFGGFPVSLDRSFGSSNLASSLTDSIKLASPLIFLLVSLLITWKVWKIRPNKKGSATFQESPASPVIFLSLIFLMAFTLTNKVFSPQYMIWFAPLLATMVGAREDMLGLGWLFLLASAITQAIFPHLYVFLKQFNPVMIVLLNLRNGLLILILVQLVRRLPCWLAAAKGD